MVRAKVAIINYLAMILKFSRYNLFYETMPRRAVSNNPW